MKKKAKPASHPWDSDTLLAKAELYAAKTIEASRDDWEFGLWASLSFEFLARAALAKISPTLLADTKHKWQHLYYALGHSPSTERYVSRSISTGEVLDRLHEILPAFNKELKDAALTLAERRNAELHSGDMTFKQSAPDVWLPRYYEASKVLLYSLGKDLKWLFGPDEADAAEKLLAAAKENKTKETQKLVAEYLASWHKLNKVEAQERAAQAKLWATKHEGHRVKCPSCESTAIVVGEAISAPKKSLDDDTIIEKQDHLPSKFECIACGLKLSGLSSLVAAGLGATYVSTSMYDASEYYAEDDSAVWEDDNNEPY